MPDWAWIIVFVVAYLVLTQWLLPKLGCADLTHQLLFCRVSTE